MSNIPITSLPIAIGLVGDEPFICVQAGTTKQVALSTISAFINPTVPSTTVTITSGATTISPFAVPVGVGTVLVDKAIGAATGLLFGLSANYAGSSIFVKDIKGDAATNNITLEFSGGEMAEGLSTVVINANYGQVRIAPLPLGGGWYIGG